MMKHLLLTGLLTLMICIFMLVFYQNSDAADPQSFGRATADQITALTNQPLTLTSSHYAFIFNNSSAVQSFNYGFSLCAVSQGCTTRTFQVSLMPHVSTNIFWNLTLQTVFLTQAQYLITATTTITGPLTNVVATGTSTADIINPFIQNGVPP